MLKKQIEPEVIEYMEQHGHCPSCLRKGQPYWVTMNPNMVKILQKIYGAIVAKGVNNIHVDHDTDGTEWEMPYSQRSNVTILRFHGLVAKYRDEAGKHKAGHWLITTRGAAFLKGNISIPKRVKIFDNEVRDHSEEMVDFKDVMKINPTLAMVDFIEYEMPTETDLTKPNHNKPIEPVFDSAGQAMLLDIPVNKPIRRME